MIDAYAQRTHYVDHIAPIWTALWGEQGTFWVAPEIARYPERLGIRARPCHAAPPGSSPIIVAGYKDARRSHGRSVILLEHGAGQTYSNESGSYAGGRGRGGVRLFLCPSERVAALNLERYPTAAAEAIGCPKLDPWHSGARPARGDTVAVSFHWDCKLSPEAGSAWDHYRDTLADLVPAFGAVLGHAHPRIFDRVERFYRNVGIEPVREFSEILDRASVYAVDNSSTLYEFASTDRPVVVLNAPWYRREVSHGLRFWELADVGISVDHPSDLVAGIARAREDPPDVATRRRQVVAEVYAACDGRAAQRGVEAVVRLARADGSRV